MDDDDGKGSRGIPSRSRIGKKASVIEKFPALGNSLVLFGGILTVPFWGYRCLSIAMTDVMMADLPHVQYGDPDKHITEEDVEKANELQKQLNERRSKGIGIPLRFQNLNGKVEG